MSDRHALALQLVALSTLSERVSARFKQVKGEMEQEVHEGERTPARLPDGTKVGGVTYTEGSTTATVVDEQEFTEFVTENYPGEMQLVVRPAFRAAVLEASKAAGVGMTHHGDLCPGITVTTGSGHLSVTKDKAAVGALEDAIRANRLLALDGPEVES